MVVAFDRITITVADLATVVERGMPLSEYLAMAIRHDTWHAGQMALVRRLYRAR